MTHQVNTFAKVTCGCGYTEQGEDELFVRDEALEHSQKTGHSCELKVEFTVEKRHRRREK